MSKCGAPVGALNGPYAWVRHGEGCRNPGTFPDGRCFHHTTAQDGWAANIRNGGDLDAQVFTDADTLADLCDLVDWGRCTPNCLFGQEEGQCQCRCDGVYHGRARDSTGSSLAEADSEADWLRTMPDHCDRCGADADWAHVTPELARLVNSSGTLHTTRAAPACQVRALYQCPRCRFMWHTSWDLRYHLGNAWWRSAQRWA